MKELKIGGVPEHFNLPWRLAIENKAFDPLGLHVDWVDMEGGTGQMITELEAGGLDIAILLTEGITLAILQGLEAKIAGIYVQSPLRWGIHVSKQLQQAQDLSLNDKVYAISRKGSGSQLMAHVKAFQENWDFSSPKFEVVGNLEGGIKALQRNSAQVFLWEKYTTQPYVDENKCARIDEVLTPWPCFVIAVRNSVAQNFENELIAIQTIVSGYAKKLKKLPEAKRLFSERYDLEPSQVQQWLSETEWSSGNHLDKQLFDTVIDYLEKTGLIKEETAKNWEERLFL